MHLLSSTKASLAAELGETGTKRTKKAEAATTHTNAHCLLNKEARNRSGFNTLLGDPLRATKAGGNADEESRVWSCRAGAQ